VAVIHRVGDSALIVFSKKSQESAEELDGVIEKAKTMVDKVLTLRQALAK
jgi:hypothetical protein